jgi:hypothetical protein
MSVTSAAPFQIYESTRFVCGEFSPAVAKKIMPAAEKVVYYICDWHYHDPPRPADFVAADLQCEIINNSPLLFHTNRLIAQLEAATYSIPTLLIVQRILPFQRAAWGLDMDDDL